MKTDTFYQNLKSFSDFDGIVQEQHFTKMPNDWIVIITDVRGSTKAIEEGRYKDVNTIGAASIVAVTKAMGDIEFPFVFGGDGASFVVPMSRYDKVVAELLGLKHLSEQRMNLGLRVGSVKVSELYANSVALSVAKYEITNGKSIAIFTGGGLNFAEDKIKNNADIYEIDSGDFSLPDLSDLSCRWNPIPNKRGVILSVLVEADSKNSQEIYQQVLAKINSIFQGKLEDANPVNIELSSYKGIGETSQTEKRMHKSTFSFGFIMRFLEIILSILIFKFKFPIPFFDTKKYSNSMKSHSDYRKFDDMLRMIIDCNLEQAQKLEEFLDAEYKQGKLFYGIHKSVDCLMTCFVPSTKQGGHIHFIDGGDGGYAMAAKQLKGQMKMSKKSVV